MSYDLEQVYDTFSFEICSLKAFYLVIYSFVITSLLLKVMDKVSSNEKFISENEAYETKSLRRKYFKRNGRQ
jgi:hypothetical protein